MAKRSPPALVSLTPFDLLARFSLLRGQGPSLALVLTPEALVLTREALVLTGRKGRKHSCPTFAAPR